MVVLNLSRQQYAQQTKICVSNISSLDIWQGPINSGPPPYKQNTNGNPSGRGPTGHHGPIRPHGPIGHSIGPATPICCLRNSPRYYYCFQPPLFETLPYPNNVQDHCKYWVAHSFHMRCTSSAPVQGLANDWHICLPMVLKWIHSPLRFTNTECLISLFFCPLILYKHTLALQRPRGAHGTMGRESRRFLKDWNLGQSAILNSKYWCGSQGHVFFCYLQKSITRAGGRSFINPRRPLHMWMVYDVTMDSAPPRSMCAQKACIFRLKGVRQMCSKSSMRRLTSKC